MDMNSLSFHVIDWILQYTVYCYHHMILIVKNRIYILPFEYILSKTFLIVVMTLKPTLSMTSILHNLPISFLVSYSTLLDICGFTVALHWNIFILVSLASMLLLIPLFGVIHSLLFIYWALIYLCLSPVLLLWYTSVNTQTHSYYPLKYLHYFYSFLMTSLTCIYSYTESLHVLLFLPPQWYFSSFDVRHLTFYLTFIVYSAPTLLCSSANFLLYWCLHLTFLLFLFFCFPPFQ